MTEEMQYLVQCRQPIPAEITKLTGITQYDVEQRGKPLKNVLEKLREFAEDFPLVCHNSAFETRFLSEACRNAGVELLENRMIDTMFLSRHLLPDLKDHKLGTVAAYFAIPCDVCHRALPDCKITYGIYDELIQLASDEMRKNEK